MLEGARFERMWRKEADDWRLKLIAVDVTHRQLLVLPEDLPKYRVPGSKDPIEPHTFKVARAARMSMSIPYFFDPVELVRVETGRPALIVDGGTLSNFPVWLFDVGPQDDGWPPARPTFGFTLKGGRGFSPPWPAKVLAPWHLRFALEIFHTAQDAWDNRFVSHSTRVRTLAVDAGDVATTDFALQPEQRQQLIANGRAAARTFLDGFDLAAYRNTYHRAVAPPAAVPAAGDGSGAGG